MSSLGADPGFTVAFHLSLGGASISLKNDRSLNLTNLSDERVSPVAGLHPYQIRASLLSLITQPLAERRHRPDSTLPGRFCHTGDFSSPAIQRCVSVLCIGSG